MKALIFGGLFVVMFIATIGLAMIGENLLAGCTFISMIAGFLLALRQAIKPA